MRKLDFWFESARLNSWELVHDTVDYVLPFYPVYAYLRDESGNTFKTAIGYCLLSENNEKFIIDVDSRIRTQPIYQRTSISARAAAEKAAKKKKASIIAAVVCGTLVLVITVLATLLPNLL